MPNRFAVMIVVSSVMSAGSVVTSGAMAQDAAAGGGTFETRAAAPIEFTVSGGYVGQFESDIDDGGTISVDRLVASVGASMKVTDKVGLGLSIGYGFDGYDFGGTTGFGGLNAWSDIHTVTLGARLTYTVNDTWTVFGGPIAQFSRERNADWSDGFTGGGAIGATYKVNDRLTIGGGVGVLSELEDDVRIFPVIVVNWTINDELRLTNGPGFGAGVGGVELVWTPRENLEVGLGASYVYRRFRLDDAGVAPGGVGEDSTLPVYLRVGYTFNSNVSASLMGGFTFAGNLALEDTNGTQISDQDYDGAGFVGASVRITF